MLGKNSYGEARNVIDDGGDEEDDKKEKKFKGI